MKIIGEKAGKAPLDGHLQIITHAQVSFMQ